MKKIILLGPKYNKLGEVGGTVISFELMYKEFKNAGIETIIIDLNKNNYPHKLIAIIQIILKTIYLIPCSRAIIFNGTAKDFKYILPIVVLFSNIFKKKIILRKFAGSFIEEYEKSSTLIKKMIEFSLRNATANFFQTKYLIKYFKKYNKNTFWLPTSREKPSIQRNCRPYQKRFIYLGHIRKEKGIYELIELSKTLDSSYTIDLYGAMIENELKTLIENSSLQYHGEVKPNDVILTLTQYDVLILPSYREGYPGVIMEALSVGLPIIASNLEGISEIIDNRCGFLVEPKNVNQLKVAIDSFTIENYQEFSLNALERFKLFDSHIVTQKVINEI